MNGTLRKFYFILLLFLNWSEMKFLLLLFRSIVVYVIERRRMEEICIVCIIRKLTSQFESLWAHLLVCYYLTLITWLVSFWLISTWLEITWIVPAWFISTWLEPIWLVLTWLKTTWSNPLESNLLDLKLFVLSSFDLNLLDSSLLDYNLLHVAGAVWCDTGTKWHDS